MTERRIKIGPLQINWFDARYHGGHAIAGAWLERVDGGCLARVVTPWLVFVASWWSRKDDEQ